MSALIAIAAILAAAGLAWRFPAWRLRRALARPMPPAQLAALARYVAPYARMPAALQAQLRSLVKQFLHQKAFIGCDGLDVTDEMRVAIAGQACLLQLNRPSKVYPALHSVLVYPTAFVAARTEVAPGGVVMQTRQGLLGESWDDGRVVLSWDHVQRGAFDWSAGSNVVLHEFAHQLDSESGRNNGAPYLGDPARYRRWSDVLSREFADLQFDATYQQHSVLDHYGASSPAEFFAVATETFFAKPHLMAEHHPELFAELRNYYSVDPRAWLPPVQAAMPAADAGHALWR